MANTPFTHKSSEDDEAANTAKYIATLLKSLVAMSSRSELTVLAYLLDMARIEAESLTQK